MIGIQVTVSGEELLTSFFHAQEMRLERNAEGLVRTVAHPRPADVPLEHAASPWMPEEVLIEMFKRDLLEWLNKALKVGLTFVSGTGFIGLAQAAQFTQGLEGPVVYKN